MVERTSNKSSLSPSKVSLPQNAHEAKMKDMAEQRRAPKALAPKPALCALDWTILAALPTGITVGAIVGVVNSGAYAIPAVVLAGLANLAWYFHATLVNLMQALRAGEREDMPDGIFADYGAAAVHPVGVDGENQERDLRIERATDDYKAHFLLLLGFTHHFALIRKYGRSIDIDLSMHPRYSATGPEFSANTSNDSMPRQSSAFQSPRFSSSPDENGTKGKKYLLNNRYTTMAMYFDWLLLGVMAVGLIIAIPLALVDTSYARLAVWIASISNLAWFWQDSGVNLVQSIWGSRREREEIFYFRTPRMTYLARVGRTKRVKCDPRYVTTYKDLFLSTYAILRLPESEELARRTMAGLHSWLKRIRSDASATRPGEPGQTARTLRSLNVGDQLVIYQSSRDSQLARVPGGDFISILDYDAGAKEILFEWSDQEPRGDAIELTLDAPVQMRQVEARRGRKIKRLQFYLATDIVLFLSVPTLLFVALIVNTGIWTTSIGLSVGLALVSNLVWLFRGYPVNLVHARRESKIKRALSIAHEAEGAANEMSLLCMSVGVAPSYKDWFFPLTGLVGNPSPAFFAELQNRSGREMRNEENSGRLCHPHAMDKSKHDHIFISELTKDIDSELFLVRHGAIFVAWVDRGRVEARVDGLGPFRLETRLQSGTRSDVVQTVSSNSSQDGKLRTTLLLSRTKPFCKIKGSIDV